jgi:hypothetical protein
VNEVLRSAAAAWSSGADVGKWRQVDSASYKYCRLHQQGKYIKIRAFCVRQVCTQCGNLLKNDMWAFVYNRELLLERKVQVLNTVITTNDVPSFAERYRRPG